MWRGISIVILICASALFALAGHDGLRSHSPFINESVTAARQTVEVRTIAEPEPEVQVELRGFFAVNGEAYVSLYDKRTGGSTWVPVGGSAYGYDLTEVSISEQRAVLSDGKNALALSLVNQADVSRSTGGMHRTKVAGVRRSFDDLTDSEKQYYRENPREILKLRSSGFSVPRKILREALSMRRGGGRNGSIAKKDGDVRSTDLASNKGREVNPPNAGAQSDGGRTTDRQRYPVPMTNVGFTKEERVAAAKAASGGGEL